MKICIGCSHHFNSAHQFCPTCYSEPEKVNGITAYAPELAISGGGFKSEYFSDLASLESDNFWFRARNHLILWALEKYAPNAKNLLEVGCGTGYVLSGIANKFPTTKLLGSEIFTAGLIFAMDRVPTADFVQMDARRIPFIDEYDVIGIFDVLEHIVEDQEVLTQLYTALKPGGVLILTVPQHPWLWSKSDDYACHVRRYTRRDLYSKVTQTGFEVTRSTSFVTSLLPVMMLSRRIQKRETKEFDPTAELAINPLINKVFYSLSMLDLTGIKLGMNYSAGGSLLIVAKKPNCNL